MYFLKGCGAYEKFINNIDINELKYYITRNNNRQNSYYKLITMSFIWLETEEGQYYWQVINDLHQIIIYYKLSKNKLKLNGIIYDTRTEQPPKRYYNIMFDNIAYLYESYIIKDKNLKYFIECLNAYIRENYEKQY